ncbi:hypothetical protein Cantr_05148 [Candida viswanathii]|uniref:Uncharacterized protein n=1 Tax=Candida viswanathii TaxID=5486 RepID=A0A367XQW0_9ASCO|nr:hypothetical protein Cantr_05148 [Candida viswanathii]
MSKTTTSSKAANSKTASIVDRGTTPTPSCSQHPPVQVLPQKLESLMKPNESQDFLFRVFTYTIIVLPTLTSILFPISSSISTSEHVGNLIIDLLTVLLLSMVVKYTMEWPYNWLRQLQRTKVTLLKEMNRENSDRTVLLVRKIYTFEIIALFSCLVSSVFSSALLIWTRQYTIIDLKRKKVVFNNVNIALLQFWSIFRIIITFTDSLQESSMNSNQLYWESPRMSSWYQDLKHYFLPNASNQILLDHLQQHNRQFDQLKLDLMSLQNEIEDQNRKIIIKDRFNNGSFTPYPLNISSSAPNSPFGTIDHAAFTSSPTHKNFPLKPLSSFSPSAPKRVSNGKSSTTSKSKSSLNTIIEEDDNTLYDSVENSYTNFDEIITTGIDFNPAPSILEELNCVLKVIFEQGSVFDILKHPNNFCHTLMAELARLSRLHFELGEYQFVKLLLSEVFDKYILDTYQSVVSELQEIWNHPLYHVRKVVIYFAFKLPLIVTWRAVTWIAYTPILIIDWVFVRPNLLVMRMVWVVLKLIFVPNAPEKAALVLPKLLSPATSPAREKQVIKPLSKAETLEKFAMKPFHLSPTLNSPAIFEGPVKKKRPAKLSLAMPATKLFIDATPTLTNSINGGLRSHRTYRYQNNRATNNFTLYDD